MDSIDNDLDVVERVLCDLARVAGANGAIRTLAAFDRRNGQFVLLNEGWAGYRRIHGVWAHVEVADGRVRIHEDGTEVGLANLFVAAGIPKDRIVLAMDAPSMRAAGEFALA